MEKELKVITTDSIDFVELETFSRLLSLRHMLNISYLPEYKGVKTISTSKEVGLDRMIGYCIVGRLKALERIGLKDVGLELISFHRDGKIPFID